MRAIPRIAGEKNLDDLIIPLEEVMDASIVPMKP